MKWLMGFAVFGLGLAVLPARAADGVLEINQVCATAPAGCFAGDTPGFPVQITQPGSYRLTSNLTVPAATHGIQLATNGADIDLGGFEIAGPVSCSGGCPAPGSGSGIARTVALGNQCSVSNGKIRGFAQDGVELSLRARVEDLTVTEVARYGIYTGGGSFVARNLVAGTGSHGIRFDLTSSTPSLYRDNTISNTGAQSVLNGRASGPNVCPDQLCATTGKRLFYMTPTNHLGANADTACAPGFHFASLYEIADVTALEYDESRGSTAPDSGQGPPSSAPGSGEAWIRTGFSSSVTATGGIGNCAVWTSSSASDNGSTAQLAQVWGTGGSLDPWSTAWDQCISLNQVWCVQD